MIKGYKNVMDERTLQIPGWKIIRTIGRGSFGAVYEVEKKDSFGAVTHSALKVISIPETSAEIKAYRDDGYDDMSLTALFRSQVEDITNEFRLMSKLKGNSNIVSYEDHEIIQHESDPGYDIYIRMELLTSLPDYIKCQYPDSIVPDEATASLGIDICNALELCAKHHIIHRDIKPQNIFVNDNNNFKLGDFGIAKTSDHTVLVAERAQRTVHAAAAADSDHPTGNGGFGTPYAWRCAARAEARQRGTEADRAKSMRVRSEGPLCESDGNEARSGTADDPVGYRSTVYGNGAGKHPVLRGRG